MRIPLATPLKTRVGDTSKDARLKNAYAEVRGEQSVVRHRPSARGGVAAGTGTAQGGIGLSINGTDTFIGFWGDTLTAYTGGGTSWSGGTAYSIGDHVSVDFVDYWSLTDANVGNTPSSSPESWSTSHVPAVPITYAELVNNLGNLEIDFSNISKSTGKWYWEVTITANDSSSSQHYLGVESAVTLSGIRWNWDGYPDGEVFKMLNGSASIPSPRPIAPLIGETLGFALDADAGLMSVRFPDGNSVAVAGMTGSPFTASFYVALAANGTVNFGASDFTYPVPVGYNSGLYTS